MEFVIEKLHGMFCIVLPQETGNSLIKQFGKRVLCELNGQTTTHSALMPIKEGGYYITIGKTNLKALGLDLGSKISVAFKADDSELQFVLTEELDAVLQTDEDALKIFNTLTDGNKRSLSYLGYCC
ncbi:MAG: DUF1905 domain-containing protein [Sphingobacteriales bacterium JAD_PAG50586_3]|nr:MAG: DUF1905 domain-containing protein [Sphingobacteriales bacterium JAD_PAG50586_3]